MIECKGCRALEFITDGIRRGNIVSFKMSEPRYNCVFGNKIVLDENEHPCCESCKDKTTRIKRLK